jgi:hypothetical protein
MIACAPSSWPATPPAALLHRCENSAQDVDLVGIGLRALQQPPDALHQVTAALGSIAEVDLLQHRGQVLIHQVHLLRRRQRRGARLGP